MKNIGTLLSSVVGFLGHHVADLKAVASSIDTIAGAVGVNAGTRQHIADTVDRLETSAANIGAALDTLKEQAAAVATGGAQVDPAALKSAVAEAVSDLIGPALKAELDRMNVDQSIANHVNEAVNNLASRFEAMTPAGAKGGNDVNDKPAGGQTTTTGAGAA